MDLNERRAGAYRKFATQSSGKNEQKMHPSEGESSAKAEARKQQTTEKRRSPLPKEALLRLTGDVAKPSRKRVAELLLLLGQEEAAKVLKHLDPEAVEKIVSEIATVETIDRKEADTVLSDFGVALQGTSGRLHGGPDRAREMLSAAFGQEAAEKILLKAVPHVAPRPFVFLNDFEPQQIHTLLRHEPPTVISVVLAHLDPKLGSRILALLDPEVQRETIKRIARLGKVDREVIGRIEMALREKIRASGKVVSSEVDGANALAEILRYLNPQESEELLGELRKDAPDLSEQIRDRLFTIDSLLLISDKELQMVLKDFPDNDIALVLKGKSEDVRFKVLRNVSERRRTFIMDEYQRLGAVPRREVDKATREFISTLKQLADDGRIIVQTSDDTYV